MGRARTIARRTFLVASAAVAGGVAFGVWAWRRPLANPLAAEAGEAALSPWVLIGPEGVTLVTPRADKGQGAIHIQAALLAEELDIDPADVTTTFGVPAPAYYNGVVAGEGMPVAATDTGTLAAFLRGTVSDAAGRMIGLQLTGGSSTVADAFDRLRAAGASARETLKAAAAVRTGVSVADLRTEGGAVVLPDGTRLPYGDLAAEAAGIDPVQDVPLRDPAQWRLLGQPMQRVDVVAKSTGTQDYGIDVRLPGMVFATVRMNPALGGALLSHDPAPALDLPGVREVIPLPGGVAVVAESTWHAFRGAEVVVCDWGPSPHPPSTDAMWQAAEAALSDDHRNSRLRDDGDVDAALPPDALTAEYRLPCLAHAPLEPVNATALYTVDSLDIWTGTQIPGFAQGAAAKLAGLSRDAVRIHNQMIGGSFGRRLEDDFIRHAVQVAMALPGTPVKLTWSREEDFAHPIPRPMVLARARGAVAGGQVQAMDLAIAAPSVTASQMGRLGIPAGGPDVAIVAGAWDQPFAIPHLRVTGHAVPDAVPVSSWRSVGASANGFVHETFFDELIHAAGADPLAERLRLCSDAESRAVLQAVGDLAGWNGARPGPGLGRGLAFTLSFGVPVAVVADVDATGGDLRLTGLFAALGVGRVLDPVTFENQVQGGLIWGLGHALGAEITFAEGRVQQTNYHDYPGLRLDQVPPIRLQAVEGMGRIRGAGEPPVPPAGPALGNAIFAATGRRIRTLPFAREVAFA